MKTPRLAFTLIELLTVIAIIGILAGILIPVTMKVRESAWAARGVQQKRQICLALATYAVENKNYYPPVAIGDSYTWYTKLSPYLPMRLNSSGGEYGEFHPIFADPKAKVKGAPSSRVKRAYSAGGSLYIPNGNSASTNAGTSARPMFGRRLDTVESPKVGVLFFDAVVSSNGKCADGTTWAKFSTDLPNFSDKLEDNTYIDYRYQGTAQFAFADYHIEALTPKKANDRFPDFRAYEGR